MYDPKTQVTVTRGWGALSGQLRLENRETYRRRWRALWSRHGSAHAVPRKHAPSPVHAARVIFERRAAKQTDLIVLPLDATVRPGETMGTKPPKDVFEQR